MGVKALPSLCSRDLQLASLPIRRVDEDQLAVVAHGQLLVGVQKLDAADRAGLVDIHVEILGQTQGLDRAGGVAEPDIGDFGLRVVGQVHRAPRKRVTIQIRIIQTTKMIHSDCCKMFVLFYRI